MTLHSMTQYDQMDPETRAQIQSSSLESSGLATLRAPLLIQYASGNIHALYEPSIAPHMHIVTCRGHDGAYLAFLVKQDNLAKALTNPNSLASEPKSTRSAALLSLLEATEQRIAELLIKSNHSQQHSQQLTKKNPVSPQPLPAPVEQKIVDYPTEKIPIDYGEKPKEKSFMSWKKHSRVESAYARQVYN